MMAGERIPKEVTLIYFLLFSFILYGLMKSSLILILLLILFLFYSTYSSFRTENHEDKRA